MRLFTQGVIILVALLHLYFAVLEMLLWQAPRTRKAFGTTADFAKATSVLAANQGLYNAFLAAGLLWALGVFGLGAGRSILSFFLACVVAAGIFGAATVHRRILWIQAAPAALALALLWSL
jgi:putative membrane protein